MDIDFTKLSVAEAAKLLKESGVDAAEAQRRAELLTDNFEDDVMDEPSLKELFLQNLEYTLKHPGHADQSVHNPLKRAGAAIGGAVAGAKKKWNEMPQEKKMALVGAAVVAGLGIGTAALGSNAGVRASINSARYRGGLAAGHRKWGGAKRGSLNQYLSTPEGTDFAIGLAQNLLRRPNT